MKVHEATFNEALNMVYFLLHNQHTGRLLVDYDMATNDFEWRSTRMPAPNVSECKVHFMTHDTIWVHLIVDGRPIGAVCKVN